ncbi:hypothetical protein [Sulfurimonas sp.]|uniref:hypothetical protein n=1 Tax=Sulfurimonas sp. TaxID=2022749 RepID=UPI0025EC58A2|nr:hypothetical protein [Sulfurimonas sp.]
MTISLWQLISGFIVLVSGFATNTFMTKQNVTKIKRIEDTFKNVITEDKARKIFVAKELYVNQMKHIDNSLADLKKQNDSILELLRK